MSVRRLSHCAVLLLAGLVLSACSRVDLAYRNLDVLIPWSVNDYLDMNREQKSWFDERLETHLRWHCTTQLPANLAWLDRIKTMVASNQVDTAALQARTAEAKVAIRQIAEEVTPSAVELLRGLDDNQVRAMQQAFAEDLTQRRKKYVALPLAEQIEERAQRMEKRLSPWLGSLNAAQQQSIQTWSSSLGEQNREWIDNREHWQNLLIAALQQRQNADFPARVAQLLQQRETLWTPEYRAAYGRTEQAAQTLLVALAQASTEQQRARLEQRLGKLHADFSKLDCLKKAS